MSPEQAREFLDSLDGEKKIYRLLEPENDKWSEGDGVAEITNLLPNQVPQWDIVSKFRSSYGYMIGKKVSALYIGRRAESRQIPDLKERVKEIMRDAMDAQFHFTASVGSEISNAERKELMDKAHAFRALCSPKVKP